jgi:amidohydrolase
MKINLAEIIELRRELHKNPELSDQEKQTAASVKEYVSQFKPDEVVENIGGYGIAFIYEGKQEGPTIMFRCELDALPINEQNQFAYRSSKSGISHKCGHDGHMAIMCGLAAVIKKQPPGTGRVVLLFQPSEETGQGANRVLEDPKFKLLHPDYIFALHNIPGYPKNKIIVKDDVFSSASIGIIIRLRGKTSHASEPENGQNPATVMAGILKKTERYFLPGNKPERIKLITPIYCKLGERAFGTSPGFTEMMFTLRATHHNDFEHLKKYLIGSIHDSLNETPHSKSLAMEYEWVEEFPNTVNDPACNDKILESAKQSGFSAEKLHFPFRWSEDFGHFLEKYPGAIFGIGAGTEHPALHNPDYDFPDELIETGIRMFFNISNNILD